MRILKKKNIGNNFNVLVNINIKSRDFPVTYDDEYQ